MGCFESHRDAWLKIAAGNANSLVLEADWTIANQSVSVLKQDFRETVVKMDVADIDLVWAGRCYGGIYCTTAYFVSPSAAPCTRHWLLIYSRSDTVFAIFP